MERAREITQRLDARALRDVRAYEQARKPIDFLALRRSAKRLVAAHPDQDEFQSRFMSLFIPLIVKGILSDPEPMGDGFYRFRRLRDAA
jgi:hypothetical protein